jgi:hypothetical protein
MKKIYVRYCGGCNPEYDRVAAVSRLLAARGLALTAEKSAACIRIAVSGCARRCAEKNPEQFIREISSPKQMEQYIAETES